MLKPRIWPKLWLIIIIGLVTAIGFICHWYFGGMWVQHKNCEHLDQLGSALSSILKIEQGLIENEPLAQLFHEEFRPDMMEVTAQFCEDAHTFSGYWDRRFWQPFVNGKMTQDIPIHVLLNLVSEQKMACPPSSLDWNGLRRFWPFLKQSTFRVDLPSQVELWRTQTASLLLRVFAQLQEDTKILCQASENRNRAENELMFYQSKCRGHQSKKCKNLDETKLIDWLKREDDHLALNINKFEQKWGSKKLAGLSCIRDDLKGEGLQTMAPNPDFGTSPDPSGKSRE